jgi:hypothetical protein
VRTRARIAANQFILVLLARTTFHLLILIVSHIFALALLSSRIPVSSLFDRRNFAPPEIIRGVIITFPKKAPSLSPIAATLA